MTDKRIATIREALVLGWSCDIPEKRKQALAALDSLASEPCTDARELAENFMRFEIDSSAQFPYIAKYSTEQVADEIQSAFDKIRQEKDAEIAALKAELQDMREIAKGNAIAADQWKREAEKLKAKNDQLRELAEQVEQWSKAYPTKIFHEPSPEEVDKVCQALGIPIDCISAMVLRQFTKLWGDMARNALASSPVEAEPVKKSKPYTDADELRGYIDAAGMFVYAPLAGDPCPHCGKTLINVSRYQDDPDWFPYCPHCERRSDVEYKDYSVETPAEAEPERGPDVGDLVVWIYAGETHVKIADETLLDAFSIDPLEHQEIVIMRAAELQRRIEAAR